MGPEGFDHISGSIVGRDHISRGGILVGKPNQDALSHHIGPHHKVFIVCDGCGSGVSSEIGAKIGARISTMVTSEMLMGVASDMWTWPMDNPGISKVGRFLEMMRGSVAGRIDSIVRSISDWRDPYDYLRTISDSFMFTLLGVIMAGEVAVTFSIGDGFFVVNDQVIRREADESNAPPYISYDLMPDSVFADPAPVRLKNRIIFECHRLEDVDSIIVASDGLRDILSNVGKSIQGKDDRLVPSVEELRGDVFFSNPSRLQRELVLMNTEKVRVTEGGELERHPAILSDDTTLYVIRKKSIGD